MKKIISFIVMCAVLIQASVFAAPALSAAGDLLETDIGAYINGCKIDSYNVNGYTAIVAEDLLKYGFNVDWNDVARTVTISRNKETEFSGKLIFDSEDVTVGKKIGTAYYTDIRTFVNGITVLSYNIGGKTAIFTDALKLFGEVSFNEAQRAVICTIDGLTYKKPLVTITDPEDEKTDIDVPLPDAEPQPDEKTYTPVETPATEYYSNGVVPNYSVITGVKLLKSEEKQNNFISYTYDNYDEFAADKYVTYLVDKEGFICSKTDKNDNSVIYYYTKGTTALGIEINNNSNTLIITCKK